MTAIPDYSDIDMFVPGLSSRLTALNLTASLAAPVDAFVTRETPSGSIDGVNVTFILANTPVVGSEEVFLDGLLQDEGTEYTITGVTITMAAPPGIGAKIRASYRK